MYQIENWRGALPGRGSRIGRGGVSRNVVLLGLTSMFTDISSEMVATILPLYLVYTLGFSPLQFGLLDGLYQGAAALLRVVGGHLADRWHRYKAIAGIGYGLSAACKPAFLAAGGAWGAIAGIVLVDRAGKGIRTAPRDALISFSSPRAELGAAFGVHRALDTAGAMLGPLVAFSLLLLAPRAFDLVFVVSFCIALVGLAILVLFVRDTAARRAVDPPAAAVSLRSGAGLLGEPRFRALVLVGVVVSLATMSDGFLYLQLQRRLDLDPSLFPLLFVGTALVYMLLSVPVGRLADRLGRERVFLAGYGLLLLAYGSLLLPAIAWLPYLIVFLVLFGAYYAATEGVLMAMASAVLPPELRGSGLALLATGAGLSRLLASVVFGALWTWLGVQAAVAVFTVGLVSSMLFGYFMLARTKERGVHA